MTKTWALNRQDYFLIDSALAEDLGDPYLDLTVKTLFPEHSAQRRVAVISKDPHDVIVSGLPVIEALFNKLNAQYQLEIACQDGENLLPGKTYLTLEAQASALLMLERTILNFLRHLSAISTLTHRFVEKVKHTHLKLLDTRKTTPGFRHIEKYAVCCGGGMNHRMGLYDAIMIKDTHIDLIGSLEKALARLPNLSKDTPSVIVEVRDFSELEKVLQYGKGKVTRVLLDNMDLKALEKSVAMCHGQIETEASGNLNLETIVGVAETGVDYASVGMLTHSAGNVDLSMRAVE